MNFLINVGAAFLMGFGTAHAADGDGMASGSGTLNHWQFEMKDGQKSMAGSEMVTFSPHHAYAYDEVGKSETLRWIVLSDKPMPRAAWLRNSNRGEPALAWCEQQKGSFIALKIGADGKSRTVDCSADGAPKMKSTNMMNDVPSIQPSFTANDGKQVKGSLVLGEGACSVEGSNGEKYELCERTGDFQFEATVSTLE